MPGERIASDVERMSHAALIAELAERVCEDRHPVDGIYELTVMALDELARETDPRRASAYFLMAALDLLGYAPQLMECASCGKTLPAKPAVFSATAGGFLCDDCAAPLASAPVVPLSAIKVLRLMASGDLATYRRPNLGRQMMEAVGRRPPGHPEHPLARPPHAAPFPPQAQG